MASQSTPTSSAPTLDLSRWRKAPVIAIGVGALFMVIGLLVAGRQGSEVLQRQFGFSWLTAFMFFLSIAMGGLFLTLAHHLFDASWSVPIRRTTEHLACLALPLFFLFVPVAWLAPKIWTWMNMVTPDHALHAKSAMLNKPFWYVRYVIYFVVWCGLAFSLRKLSVAQDKDGAAKWTFKMRAVSSVGIFLFAFTVTSAAIDWMMALQHQWFSTMYGVIYFAGSVWMTLATVYVIVLMRRNIGELRGVLFPTHFYYIGSLLLAFTVFYAYVHFSQYFIIWNANMPEETFWYKSREQGTWWWVGMVIIFGHFFVPFLTLLRIDFKLKLAIMAPLAIWAWLMHYMDLAFNILPALHPQNYAPHWMDVGSFLLIGGILAIVFLRSLKTSAPYPLRDPRLKESLTSHELPAAEPAEAAH
ncbi:MAG TPA: hypothetical protein VK530_17500 [Candidatus Acidoferrum sp.]|nr:hypothetical protein [Candidatus Acidoferrum sp.]